MLQARPTITIDWQQFHRNCIALIRRLPLDEIIDLMPVARGGFVPATILSYATKKPINTVIYPDQETLLDRQALYWCDKRGMCIIDDVCDTGATFNKLRLCFPNAIYAAVYVKESGKPHCHYYGTTCHDDVWIEFPYGE